MSQPYTANLFPLFVSDFFPLYVAVGNYIRYVEEFDYRMIDRSQVRW